MILRWLEEVLHPPQKFERPPFWCGWSYDIKNYGFEITFKGIISARNFVKNLPVGSEVDRGVQTHRQTG
jgi:hypothetical protein